MKLGYFLLDGSRFQIDVDEDFNFEDSECNLMSTNPKRVRNRCSDCFPSPSQTE